MPAKILVVDDEPDLEHLIRRNLEKKYGKSNFIFAHNGFER